ncbi:MAG: 4Fe-4S binding protein [Eubacteriales bacterium]|nr:4Fe-4S binding protein [Eubacteriales bacterium]
MKKLLILSGKGGTGKTTTAAAFIRFAQAHAFADCDVDAPNLHIVTNVQSQPEYTDYLGSKVAHIDSARCTGCGACREHCRFDAVRFADGFCTINESSCEGCGVCEYICPESAVTLRDDVSGKLTLYRGDPVFSTAELRMGRGNSGKLVTEVKNAMSAAAKNVPLAIIDGSPGIGCPVIASVTGVDLVLIVSEPSLSGFSDLTRILKTAEILRARVAVCVNKFDSSPQNADAIQQYCEKNAIPFVGKIPYDAQASAAINAGRSLADVPCPARDALYSVYQATMKVMGGSEV